MWIQEWILNCVGWAFELFCWWLLVRAGMSVLRWLRAFWSAQPRRAQTQAQTQRRRPKTPLAQVRPACVSRTGARVMNVLTGCPSTITPASKEVKEPAKQPQQQPAQQGKAQQPHHAKQHKAAAKGAASTSGRRDVAAAAAVTGSGGGAGSIATAVATATEAAEEADTCFVCMAAPPTLGFRHRGNVVHVGVCGGCMDGLRGRGWARTCPLCMGPVLMLQPLDQQDEQDGA
eukprot:XP_001698041.1 predicted protein [Chlamydomonas reinhardtii]